MSSRLILAAVVAISVPRELLAQSGPPKRQLVQEMRLDASAEDFPDIQSVHVSPRGQIAVMVAADQQLRFYDPAGKKTATFGRAGSGPGEFRRAVWFGWTADTLWAYDTDQRRISYISPSVSLIRTEVLPQSLNGGFRAPGGSAPAGPPAPPVEGAIMLFTPNAVAAGKFVGTGLIRGGRGAGGTVESKAYVMAIPRGVATRVEESGELKLKQAGDSVVTTERRLLIERPSLTNSSVGYQPGDGTSFSAVIPFTFSPQVQFSPDGSRFGMLTVEPGSDGGTYTLVVMTTGGDSVFKRSYRYAGTRIPASSIDSALDRIGIGSDGKQFFPPTVVPTLREMVKDRMPTFYQPVSALVLGRDNTAWIQTRRTAQGSSAILIDAKGNQVAIVDLPPKTRIAQGTRDYIWAIQTDADDLPSVVRFRVR